MCGENSYGRLAQLVEQLIYTETVGGSSPSPPTSIIKPGIKSGFIMSHLGTVRDLNRQCGALSRRGTRSSFKFIGSNSPPTAEKTPDIKSGVFCTAGAVRDLKGGKTQSGRLCLEPGSRKFCFNKTICDQVPVFTAHRNKVTRTVAQLACERCAGREKVVDSFDRRKKVSYNLNRFCKNQVP